MRFRTLGWLAVAALFALLPLAACAEKVESLPQPTNYVSDFAHVLSPETVARLNSLCSQLDQGAKAKVAVVTVQSLDGDDAASYATSLEDHWKMGDKGENRFALVLLAVNDHKYRIEVGYGLEGILPDGKTGDIGRGMVPLLRRADYDGALGGATGEIAHVIAADAKVTLTGEEPAVEQRAARHGSSLGKLIFIVVLLLFFGGFSLIRILFGAGLFFGGFGGGGWRGGGGGFGGGGFGGGDGGGGFGGFGGDGGGFGGGGAGGSW
ncbi:MAG: TPM domain-containing protein [Terracidiphilus sp.]|nr:TPM domain-containing protein [Terracidiphilus sp.]